MDKLLLKLDLNLLRTMHVLLDEQNVTKAAARLSVTQPAISRGLQKLREIFDDPLFVRTRYGLTPTPKALSLSAPLNDMFEKLASVTSREHFEPAVAEGTIRIASAEQFAILTIPYLVRQISALSPNLKIESVDLTDNYLDQLSDGTLDFAIDREIPKSDAFQVIQLYEAQPMLWCGNKHPLANKATIKFSDIFLYPQIAFKTTYASSNQYRSIAQAAAASGYSFHIVLDTSHLMEALNVLVGSDFIMLAPDYLSKMPVKPDKLKARPINHIEHFEGFKLTLNLIQHERTAHSALHEWISKRISLTLPE